MKTLFLHLLFLSVALNVFGAEQSGISNNGKYVYSCEEDPGGYLMRSLTVRSTMGSWTKTVPLASSPQFSPDSRLVCYLKGTTLYHLALGTDRIDSAINVRKYEFVPGSSVLQLLYLNGSDKNLLIRNLKSGRELAVGGAEEHFLSKDAKDLFVIAEIGNKVHREKAMYFIDLATLGCRRVWGSADGAIECRAFADKDNTLCFMSRENGRRSLFRYVIGSTRAELLMDDHSGLPLGYKLAEVKFLQFVPDGSKLLCYLQIVKNVNGARQGPEIYSYLDGTDQSATLRGSEMADRRMASIDLATKKTILVERENDLAVANGYASYKNVIRNVQANNDFVLVYHFDRDVLKYSSFDNGIVPVYLMEEFAFNAALRPDIYMVSLVDGRRQLLEGKVKVASASLPLYQFDPTGERIIYYSQDDDHYHLIELDSRHRTRLSQGVGTGFAFRNEKLQVRNFNDVFKKVIWVDGGRGILVQDRFSDVWMMNLDGSRTENLTRGYARKNSLWLTIENDENSIKEKERLLIRAEDRNALRSAGYLSLRLNLREGVSPMVEVGSGFRYQSIQKAADANVYLLTRQSSTSRLQAYFTADFRKIVSIAAQPRTEQQPVSQRMVEWKDFNGRLQQGIIYYPKGFDSLRTYPVLINYYEFSTTKNTFLEVYRDYGDEPATGQGYIVFLPAIKYEIGQIGPSAYNCVVSGAKMLQRLRYVQADKIGIFGGSFGGFVTNYIVAHTNIFAAALTVAGTSDLISNLGVEELDREGFSHSAVTGQMSFGVSLWERPDIYLQNSPVFYADRINTPILLMHGSEDQRVPFAQGMEFFKALRRNGKRAWLIAVKDGHMGASLGTVRSIYVRQFFDHYLKQMPAPLWMTREVRGNSEVDGSPTEYDTLIKSPPLKGVLLDKRIMTAPEMDLLRKRTKVDSLGKIIEIKGSFN